MRKYLKVFAYITEILHWHSLKGGIFWIFELFSVLDIFRIRKPNWSSFFLYWNLWSSLWYIKTFFSLMVFGAQGDSHGNPFYLRFTMHRKMQFTYRAMKLTNISTQNMSILYQSKVIQSRCKWWTLNTEHFEYDDNG